MAGETPITIIGNLTADPELRFLQNGSAVANFSVASTPRTYNRQSQQWEDGEPMFLRCSAWNQLGEHVAESLQKGMRVIVQGNLRQRSWQTDNGEKRSAFEVDVQEVGPSLRFAVASVQRAQAQQGFDGGQQQAQQGFGGQQQGFGGGQTQQGFGGGQAQQGFGGQQPQQQQQQNAQQQQQGGQQAQQDPWNSAPSNFGGADEQPPF